MLLVDPRARTVHWLGLTDVAYAPIERSRLGTLGAGELATRIDWP